MDNIGERLLLLGYTKRDFNYHLSTPLSGRNYHITIEVCMHHLNFMVSVEAPITLMVNPTALRLSDDNMTAITELSLTTSVERFHQLLDTLTGE